jgi:hypothetical protein
MAKSLRAAAAWLVAVLVSALTTAGMPHISAHHDADFDIIVVAHDASAHHVAGGDGGQAPEHCIACHFGRSFRTGHGANTLGAPMTIPAPLCFVADAFVPDCAAAALPPLRSPPAVPQLS